MEALTKLTTVIVYWLFFWMILGLTEESIKYAGILSIFYQSFEEIKQLLKK